MPKPAKVPAIRVQSTKTIQIKRRKLPDPWRTGRDIALHLGKGGVALENYPKVRQWAPSTMGPDITTVFYRSMSGP